MHLVRWVGLSASACCSCYGRCSIKPSSDFFTIRCVRWTICSINTGAPTMNDSEWLRRIHTDTQAMKKDTAKVVLPAICPWRGVEMRRSLLGDGIGFGRAGAGEGNRTLVCCLGSNCSTIELHPRSGVDWYLYPTDASTSFLVYHGISLMQIRFSSKINGLGKK